MARKRRARSAINGDASAKPTSHSGAVEALRTLKIVHRSVNKARTQALNQIRDIVTTAPDALRAELRGLRRRQLLTVCAAFRPADRDDVLALTKVDVERRTKEGLGKTEIIRCLKRYVARETFDLLSRELLV